MKQRFSGVMGYLLPLLAFSCVCGLFVASVGFSLRLWAVCCICGLFVASVGCVLRLWVVCCVSGLFVALWAICGGNETNGQISCFVVVVVPVECC